MLVGAWYIAWSVVTFVVFAIDKRLAQRGARRVPERTLHGLSLAGGFVGAIAAMMLVRHKNRKVGFVVITVVIAGTHVGAWVVGWMVRRMMM